MDHVAARDSESPRSPESAPIRPAQPFLKCAGGKRQLLPELLARIPPMYGAYHEPFVGGGALYFALSGGLSGRRARLNDSNPAFVEAYRALQAYPTQLIARLKELADTAEVYSETREVFNLGMAREPALSFGLLVARAAMCIYLNKTCFNGLWRVNGKGHFNVPYDGTRVGRRTICDEGSLRAASSALASTDILCGDFADACAAAKAGDFVYCDPPYVPLVDPTEAKGRSFTRYTVVDFRHADQERLATTLRELDGRGVQWMLSNAESPVVRELYRDYRIEMVNARRAINSSAEGRGAIGELLIRNY